MVGILRDDSEHSCFGLGTSRHVPESKPTSPFFAVQNKAGSVDAIATPSLSVVPLPVGELLARPFVTPTKVVPVINVKGYRHKVTPQLGFLFQLTQPRLGWRATAATLRRKKLQQRGLTLVTLKHNGVGVGRDTGKNTQNEGELYTHTVFPVIRPGATDRLKTPRPCSCPSRRFPDIARRAQCRIGAVWSSSPPPVSTTGKFSLTSTSCWKRIGGMLVAAVKTCA